jgi:pimeloyl-ACP methyl ester carboxylesterase
MPRTAVNGVELYWELTGEKGEPIVLVHGSWVDHHAWDLVVPTLSHSFRVLTYDRRGHSLSERPNRQGSIHEDVADLAELIEHLDLAPAHIVGESLGGIVVLFLAIKRPELFRSLIVHEPPLREFYSDPAATDQPPSGQEWPRPVLDLLEAGQLEAGARLFLETVAFGPGGWAQVPQALRDSFVFNAPAYLDDERDPDWRTIGLEALSRFSGPVLLSQGELGEPGFVKVLDKIETALPQARRIILSGAGHIPRATHPNQYVEAIASFIQQKRSGETIVR